MHRSRAGLPRTGLFCAALAMSAVVGTSIGPLAPAAAAPAAPAPAAPGDTMTLPPIPFDAQLAEAVRVLKSSGADKIALQAAQAVISAAGQISVDDIIGKLSGLQLSQVSAPLGATHEAASLDPSALLKTLGIQTLTPSVAPFCAAPTADNPLGLVTAGTGAVAGPWPLKQDPLSPLASILKMIPGVKIPQTPNLVDKGQIAYAFVPASTSGGTGGNMRVAWFNTSTFQGGFADLEPVADKRILAVLPLLSGVRLAPVKTGSGTVLSAIYGTAENGGRTCYFLPSVGVVTA